MNDGDIVHAQNDWQTAKPCDAFWAKPLPGRRPRDLEQDLTQVLPAGIRDCQYRQLLRLPQHFIGIAANSFPPQLTKSVQYLAWAIAIGDQIAGMEHRVGDSDL